jgi:HAD superfamily hydrolase (TIGR01509 family)
MPARFAASPVRALVFDLDGLLVDSEPIWFEVEGGFLARHGHVWTREMAVRCMGQGTPNTLRVMRDTFGIEVDVARDTERVVDDMIARAGAMRLMPGALALVEWGRDRGLPMAVASSSPRRLIEAVLAAKGIRARFSAVISGQEVARAKPWPDVFLGAADLLGVACASCVVLEDSLAGVKSAVAAGSRVIAVPSVANSEFQALATAVVSSLEEVPALLGAT